MLERTLEVFGLQHIGRDCARLRMYLPTSDTLQEPVLASEETTLEAQGLSSYRCLLLETREAEADWPPYDPNRIDLKVTFYDPVAKAFTSSAFAATKTDTVGAIRAGLAAKYKIAPERLRMLHERGPYDLMPYTQLIDDVKVFHTSYGLYDGFRLSVEECDDGKSVAFTASPSADNILSTRSKVTVRLTISHPGPAMREEHVQADKRTTLGEFKKQISAVVGLEPENMQVSRGTTNWKWELKDTAISLDSHFVTDGSEIFIDKGRPMKPGEYKVNIHLYDPKRPAPPGLPCSYQKLFEALLTEGDIVADAKRELARLVAEHPQLPKELPAISPATLRLRELSSTSQIPGKPFVDSLTIKECCFLYNGKNLAIQLLDGPEPVKTKQHVQVYVQRWHPATLALDARDELILMDTSTITDLRLALEKHSGLAASSISIAKGSYAATDGLSILEAATELEWDKVALTEKETRLSEAPLYLRETDTIVFREIAEKAKELSIQERQQLEKEASAARGSRYSSYSHHETALKIKKDRLDS